MKPSRIRGKSEAQKDNKSIGQFTIGEKLGEGTFGKVRLGTHKLTGEKVNKI